jgi:anti-sigma B factor antagonist
MVNIERRDKIEIISFTVNKIDAMITEEVRQVINKVFDNAHSKAILDLKGVQYIDSSGFSCFLSGHKAARNNFGILKIANPEPGILELFQTLHLHTVFQIYDDLDTCIRTFR